MIKTKFKSIIVSGILVLTLVGCSSAPKQGSTSSSNNSSASRSGGRASNLKGDRVDLYGAYKRDNFPIANPVSYLKYKNDMESPKSPFKNYTEAEFLAFYKNIKAKGHGDNSNYWRWKVSVSKKEIGNILNNNLLRIYNRRPREVLTYSNGNWISQKLSLNPVGEVRNIRVLERGKSGIIIKLLIEGTRGTYLVIREGNVRNVFGLARDNTGTTINLYGAKGGSNNYNERVLSTNPGALPSGFFALEKTASGGFNIYGGGYGHGSGVPQWSAMDLTKNKGYSYKKVLERYYENVKLKSIRSVKGIDSKVRVGIMTSGFSTIDHQKVGMYSQGAIKIRSRGGNVDIPARTQMEIITKDGFTQVITQGKVRLKTKHNLAITSNRMISLTNIRRNVKNTKYPTYRGNFEVRLVKNGTRLNLINEIDIEDYLLQVVPSEMPRSFGLEALKVQAVAARTYAAKDILRNRYKSSGFHILDSTQSQVYNNLDENDLSTQAIKSTKGLILVHEDKPIDAKYYSTSSGFNSSAHNVW